MWHSPKARALVANHQLGALIRIGREGRGWRQADLGVRIGCSASTVSRLEQRGHHADLRLLRKAASEVGLPTDVLAECLGLARPTTTSLALS
ncbi:helix-turn-helix transcriptional regulator [Streptomyces microflavus]|uniref:helix-turn-helix domain-containing protein n=1 Tax=Streptomyces microflavus TaxID=1919 RepID=UPI00340B2DD9